MENAFYYTYETTNLTNGRKYIGQHCTYNLNDGYYCSDKDLKYDVKVNGHKYVTIILEHFTNIFDLGDAEYNEIKSRNAHNDINYYNDRLHKYYNYSFEYGRSEATKQKIRATMRANPKKYGQANKGRKAWNSGLTREDPRVNKYSINQGLSNRGRTPWNKNKKQAWIYKDDKSKMCLIENIDEYIEKGWKPGRLPFKKLN